MYKHLFTFLLLVVMSSVPVKAGGPEYLKKKEESMARKMQKSTLSKLITIEKKIATAPEACIQELDGIIKYSIENNLSQSLTKAYWLMGKAYKELQQGEIALHFMRLSSQSEPKDLAVELVLDKKKTNHFNDENKYIKGDAKLEVSPLKTKAIKPGFISDMGDIYAQLGQYEKSTEQYQLLKKSLSHVSSRSVNIDFKIAQNHYAAKNYQKAIDLYTKLLKEREVYQDLEKTSTCNSRIAACYISLGNTEEGLRYYQLSTQGLSGSGNQSDLNTSFSKNKEEVTKALREQKKFKEEANVRNTAAVLLNDGLEHLKLSQSYFEDKNIQQAETSLDKYFKDISYNLLDLKEINVIEKMAIILKQKGQYQKALNYLIWHKELSDTINNRLAQLQQKSARLGSLGFQNAIELEVLQKDKEISDNAIGHLMREQELQSDVVGFQKGLIYLLSALIIIGIGSTVYIMKVSKQRRVANQQLAIRSLRSQMNPHFIFNALNSVNSFISLNDERSANKFLTEFSTLMRSVMENSDHDFIPLSKELEILKLYVGLEHFRFKDKFTYNIEIDSELDEDELVIPPMLIQPYIENSIWHGLRYKEESGQLLLSFKGDGNKLLVTIQDDGIGRKRSQELKTKNQRKNKSTAIKNIDQRIGLISSLHNIDVKVVIQDLNDDGTGTKITLVVPQPQLG